MKVFFFFVLICSALTTYAVVQDFKIGIRLIPADVLRDFRNGCFASTQCKVFQPNETWSLLPHCGYSRCVNQTATGRLLEEVVDCGPVINIKEFPNCQLVPDSFNVSDVFPNCCPKYECLGDDTSIIFPDAKPKTKAPVVVTEAPVKQTDYAPDYVEYEDPENVQYEDLNPENVQYQDIENVQNQDPVNIEYQDIEDVQNQDPANVQYEDPENIQYEDPENVEYQDQDLANFEYQDIENVQNQDPENVQYDDLNPKDAQYQDIENAQYQDIEDTLYQDPETVQYEDAQTSPVEEVQSAPVEEAESAPVEEEEYVEDSA